MTLQLTARLQSYVSGQDVHVKYNEFAAGYPPPPADTIIATLTPRVVPLVLGLVGVIRDTCGYISSPVEPVPHWATQHTQKFCDGEVYDLDTHHIWDITASGGEYRFTLWTRNPIKRPHTPTDFLIHTKLRRHGKELAIVDHGMQDPLVKTVIDYFKQIQPRYTVTDPIIVQK